MIDKVIEAHETLLEYSKKARINPAGRKMEYTEWWILIFIILRKREIITQF